MGANRRIAALDHASPQRCGLRARSCADGLGIPSPVRDSAMAYRPRPDAYSWKMRSTTGAVSGSGSRAVQSLPDAGLAGVGVRPGIREAVAIGRAAPEETALPGGLGGHRGADPDLDAVALALGH